MTSTQAIFSKRPHSFHIPVMGTSFTIETPIHVAKFGISSVLSIGDDELCETMREIISERYGLSFTPISKKEYDYRSNRITAYLNLLDDVLEIQYKEMVALPFEPGNVLYQYFDMLSDHSPVKAQFKQLLSENNPAKRQLLETELKSQIQFGAIDVNIMTKIDRNNYDIHNNLLPDEFSDALSALRGYANSRIRSGIVFSAGFNRRLYSYIEKFKDFFPDENGDIKKRIILKVSDFRSSLTQGKFLAKKGVWVSEHRIESGLNCGGHAFATDGVLMGPILEEFKTRKAELVQQLKEICNDALAKKNAPLLTDDTSTLITVQGGIGTANEQQFLMDHYQVDGTGWATPFLLVPEATTLDEPTRALLTEAKEADLYLSGVSPLGVPFNTVRNTESEKLKLKRFEDGSPGSPCPKAHLVSNIEFSKKPVCTASKFYQRRKIEQLKSLGLGVDALKDAIRKVVDKACLCEDLAASALIENDKENKRPLAPAVCPGPNLAYFSKIASLSEMIGHIYGRLNLLNDTYRPNFLIKELKLYVDYLKREVQSSLPKPSESQVKYFQAFKENLFSGIDYYKQLIPKWVEDAHTYQDHMKDDLHHLKADLDTFIKENAIAFSLPTATV